METRVMKLHIALCGANGVTYPKPRIGMLTSPTWSEDGRITSAMFDGEPIIDPVFRTARREDEQDVPAPLMAVEHLDLGVFIDWVWNCKVERDALRVKVLELETDNSDLQRLRDYLAMDLRELRAALSDAAATLRRYEEYHRAKGTEESLAKAEVNAHLANRFEMIIAEGKAL